MSQVSEHKAPALIPMVLHSSRGDYKLLVSEKTIGNAIILHIQSKIPREDNDSLTPMIKYKGSNYPLGKDLTSKYLFDNYQESDGKLHIQLLRLDTFG
jgi:hypothetical protein